MSTNTPVPDPDQLNEFKDLDMGESAEDENIPSPDTPEPKAKPATPPKPKDKVDSAKTKQKNAVEVASKVAVRQVTGERDTARTKCDNESESKRVFMVVAAAAVILLCVSVAHDLFESAPSLSGQATQPKAAVQQPAAEEGDPNLDPILESIRSMTKNEADSGANK